MHRGIQMYSIVGGKGFSSERHESHSLWCERLSSERHESHSLWRERLNSGPKHGLL